MMNCTDVDPMNKSGARAEIIELLTTLQNPNTPQPIKEAPVAYQSRIQYLIKEFKISRRELGNIGDEELNKLHMPLCFPN